MIRRHGLAVEGGSLPLTFAESDAAGASVVIFPSAFGVGPDLEAQLQELSDAGLVVAFDAFFRQGSGVVPYDDHPRVMERVRGIDRETAYFDLRAAIDWARSRKPGRPVVAVGVCFGGPFALRAAADGAVDGVVTWHGTRLENYLALAEQIRCPLRLHFGEADPITPPPVIETVGQAFAEHDVQIVVHPGATHGYTHRGAPAYDESAERASMEAVRELVHRL